MPNPRQPAEKARVTGAANKNPQRHRSRAQHKARPLGQPYVRMSEAEQEFWFELAQEIPWLNSSDRRALRELCELLAEKDDLRDQGEVVPQALRNQIRMYLNNFGATPSDRSKVIAPEEESNDDPAAGYIN